MKVNQLQWTKADGWPTPDFETGTADLILAFGGVDEVPQEEVYNDLKALFPNARIVIASTAGEIIGEEVHDNTVVANVMSFEKTKIEAVEVDVKGFETSAAVGAALANGLTHEDLKHVLIISDGSLVNGDSLVKGLNEHFPSDVLITGGLAADAGRFSATFVGLDHSPENGKVVAIGLYGDAIRVGHGSMGGWDEFGPIRQVTNSEGNVLFQLDDSPALELYKKYLGEKSKDLPGAALLFPLCVYSDNETESLVRTILSIDDESGSMTFAGDIPKGANVRFMMANFDRLVEGAEKAAGLGGKMLNDETPEFTLMVSCVGRKMILGERTEDEVEAVVEKLGESIYSGFYSNGEITPLNGKFACSLHNQTMTITTYREA